MDDKGVSHGVNSGVDESGESSEQTGVLKLKVARQFKRICKEDAALDTEMIEYLLQEFQSKGESLHPSSDNFWSSFRQDIKANFSFTSKVYPKILEEDLQKQVMLPLLKQMKRQNPDSTKTKLEEKNGVLLVSNEDQKLISWKDQNSLLSEVSNQAETCI